MARPFSGSIAGVALHLELILSSRALRQSQRPRFHWNLGIDPKPGERNEPLISEHFDTRMDRCATAHFLRAAAGRGGKKLLRGYSRLFAVGYFREILLANKNEY
jgi:hypothetical protein